MSQIELNHKTTLLNPKSLKPSETNAARHPEDQIEMMKRAFSKYGFIGAVIIGSDKKILAGHGRVQAAIELGMPKIPVVDVSHLGADEQAAYMIAENKIGELKTWDEEMLQSEIDRLVDLENFDFADLGLDLDEYQATLEDVEFDLPSDGEKRKLDSVESNYDDSDGDGEPSVSEPKDKKPKGFEVSCPVCQHSFMAVK